jgi:hypothetical protein
VKWRHTKRALRKLDEGRPLTRREEQLVVAVQKWLFKTTLRDIRATMKRLGESAVRFLLNPME